MKKINEVCTKQFAGLPEKVLQFGEGNFLRAFVDWMIELSNRQGGLNGSVVICQPISTGRAEALNEQDCMYTVIMRGAENGEPAEKTEVISSVSRCINPYADYDALLEVFRNPELRFIVSNTTEAGIAYHAGDKLEDRPPVSYPAKLCALLYERFKTFNGDKEKGLLVLPVELIDNNGHELHRIILQYANEWNLGKEFTEWIDSACEIGSTLVDRIVTGYPRNQAQELEARLGYTDNSLDTCELFNLWVIEVRNPEKWSKEFPIGETSAHVIWTNDVTPYKKRKVRILNGAHTSTVLAAYLAGFDIVRDFMHDDQFRSYMNDLLLNEVVPTLDLPKDDLLAFADAVNDRFANPFIDHRLLDIALNSCSKFNARCMPSLLGYIDAQNRLPSHLCFALAAFIRFYHGDLQDGKFIGVREDGTKYEIRDDASVLSFFDKTWKNDDVSAIVHDVLSNMDFWSGKDLSEITGLEELVTNDLNSILTVGIRKTMETL